MDNQYPKRRQQHRNNDGRPAKYPRWNHRDSRLNHQYNHNRNHNYYEGHSDFRRYEYSSYGPGHDRSWPMGHRGSFHPQQMPYQRQFFPTHYSQNQFRFQGAPPMYNYQQQQQQQQPSIQTSWRPQVYQPPHSLTPPWEAECSTTTDSSASSSPSSSASKTHACPGYFTTPITPPNSSPPSSTEYEPVFTTKTVKSRPALPHEAAFKSFKCNTEKNQAPNLLDILDPRFLQVVQYLSSFKNEIQESSEIKVKTEVDETEVKTEVRETEEKKEPREELQSLGESKKQQGTNDKQIFPVEKLDITDSSKFNRAKWIQLLYKNKICSSCEGVFKDSEHLDAHSCFQEKTNDGWFPSINNWINSTHDRDTSDEGATN